MRTIINALRGIGFKHAHVGAARGLLEATVIGGLTAFGLAFTSLDLEVLGVPTYVIPFAVGGVLFGKRTAEGWADGIDPTTPRNPNTMP